MTLQGREPVRKISREEAKKRISIIWEAAVKAAEWRDYDSDRK